MNDEENRKIIESLSELAVSMLVALGEEGGRLDFFSHPSFCDLPEQTVIDAMDELEGLGLICPPEDE